MAVLNITSPTYHSLHETLVECVKTHFARLLKERLEPKIYLYAELIEGKSREKVSAKLKKKEKKTVVRQYGIKFTLWSTFYEHHRPHSLEASHKCRVAFPLTLL